jgi:hypothetical protein
MDNILIPKVIKAMEATQVSKSPTYYKNHHKGLHHYEQVVWSKVSLLSK